MAGQDKRIIELPAGDNILDSDFFAVDNNLTEGNPDAGSRKFQVKDGIRSVIEKSLTQAQYDALPSSKNTDGIIYYLTDSNKIMLNGNSYGGGGDVVELTQAEYDALPDTKLTDGVLYAIKDAEAPSIVTDVIVDGESVVNEDGEAEIDLSGIKEDIEDLTDEVVTKQVDTQVYGQSLVNNNKVAILDKLTAIGSASGDIATFSDGANLPMPKLEVGIEPVQDLHGYDAPWVGGAGKNKCPINESTITGATYIVDTDINIASGTWTFSFESAVTTNCSLQITDADGNTLASVGISNPSRSATVTINAVGKHLKFYGYAGTYKKIQLESGSTATTYEPYSNICPIIGWSSTNVSVASKNLSKSQTNNSVLCSAKKGVTYTVSFEGNVGANIKKNTNSGEVVIWGAQLPLTFTADEDFNIFLNAWNANISNIQVEVGNQATAYEAFNGHTYTIDLDGTRYGGKLDVVSGELVVDRYYQNLGGLTWVKITNERGDFFVASGLPNIKTPDNSICSQYKLGNPYGSNDDAIFYAYQGGTSCNVLVRDSRYTDATAFKTAMSGVQLVYELATPQTIQLPTTVVKSLRGMNNVYADSGAILDAEYIRDLTTIINYILEQLEG